MMHELKTEPPWFERVAAAEKTVEVRKDDRDFQVGDILRLREWDPNGDPVYDSVHGYQKYTSREINVVVTHALRDFQGITPGWVALSIAITGGTTNG